MTKSCVFLKATERSKSYVAGILERGAASYGIVTLFPVDGEYNLAAVTCKDFDETGGIFSSLQRSYSSIEKFLPLTLKEKTGFERSQNEALRCKCLFALETERSKEESALRHLCNVDGVVKASLTHGDFNVLGVAEVRTAYELRELKRLGIETTPGLLRNLNLEVAEGGFAVDGDGNVRRLRN